MRQDNGTKIEHLSKKLNGLLSMPQQTVPLEFIHFRNREWAKGTYKKKLGMDSLFLEWLLLKHDQIEDATSLGQGWESDGILDGFKLDFKEIQNQHRTFGIHTKEKFDQYKNNYDNELLDLVVFYSTRRNYKNPRLLKAGDNVKFYYRGLIDVQDMLNESKPSHYPRGYKFISLNNQLITK